MERKTHKESWKGEESVKERFHLKAKDVRMQGPCLRLGVAWVCVPAVKERFHVKAKDVSMRPPLLLGRVPFISLSGARFTQRPLQQ